ncbi:glutathione transferase GstA [Govanella unica]|uniref:Glutathione transferase GstA n=1 Tax=Govanella unica TaxID=2975056 RepID=A0A9X3TZA7_9PROT|nr:glutathione transferase GstA [Govania unica]MDA5194167.1 glutathione transferase GstA [Govania unica]
MKLYYTPGACSLAPHIVAEEAGLKYDLVKVDLGTHKTESGVDYYSINPRGYVPALVLDGGATVTEVGSLIEYLSDQNPSAGLMPAVGSLDRVQTRSWIVFIATEIHKTFAPLFSPKTPAEMRETLIARLQTRFKELDERLATQDWIMGAHFSVVDAYAFTILNWSNFIKLDLSDYSHLVSYMARVAARPAVHAAMKAEGLVQ